MFALFPSLLPLNRGFACVAVARSGLNNAGKLEISVSPVNLGINNVLLFFSPLEDHLVLLDLNSLIPFFTEESY